MNDQLTKEQRDAIEMLFAAHFDADPLRIAAAERNLEFLAEIQGLPMEKAA